MIHRQLVPWQDPVTIVLLLRRVRCARHVQNRFPKSNEDGADLLRGRPTGDQGLFRSREHPATQGHSDP